MLILALDSAMNGCGVGLHDFDNNINVSKTLEMTRGQAEALLPMIQDVLKEARKDFKDIEMIAVTQGPGAFTGLRIAMATAKSLGLALDVPVAGVCTFESVLLTALNNPILCDAQKVTVVLETKRRDFYICTFDENQNAITDKMALVADDVEEVIKDSDVIVGDAVKRLSEEVSSHDCEVVEITMPDTKAIAKQVSILKVISCEPAYIRPPDAIVAKNIRHIKSE